MSEVEITYTAGYETIPSDFTWQQLSQQLLSKDSRENRLGIEQEKEGDVQYVYSKKDSEMPENILKK